jgi:hypothetical protein
MKAAIHVFYNAEVHVLTWEPPSHIKAMLQPSANRCNHHYTPVSQPYLPRHKVDCNC